jgi:hypothetical protein
MIAINKNSVLYTVTKRYVHPQICVFQYATAFFVVNQYFHVIHHSQKPLSTHFYVTAPSSNLFINRIFYFYHGQTYMYTYYFGYFEVNVVYVLRCLILLG